MKVLVVDDDASIRDLVKELVDYYCLGTTTTVVMGIDGWDGWRKFQESRPDLVITDLQMETEDAGIELAKKIKDVSPNTPVIMITGEEIEETRGIDYIMRKPLDGEVLTEKIKEFLERGKKDVLRG